MKKKILIYEYSMEIGGIEKSLLGLLESIDYSKYEVDLFIMKHMGELMEYIPKEVNVLEEDPYARVTGVPIKNLLFQGDIYAFLVRMYSKIKEKCQRIRGKQISGEYLSQITYPLLIKKFGKIKKEYDLAISFYWPHYYILNNVRAKKKVGWIHTDYSNIKLDIEKDIKMWGQLDKVIAVADKSKETFLEVMDRRELVEKTMVIENILPEKLIKKQALEKVELNHEKSQIVLLSIGRYDEPKNFDNVPEICYKIIEKGVDVVWYIIGYGKNGQIIRDNIKKYNMQDHVILLGKKENPYPYIKECDIYIQPSRYEGKAVTVREAQMFCKPVVITKFPSSDSQLEDGKDGIIVPMDNEGCAHGIVNLIKNEYMQKYLSENCRQNDYTNKDEIYKIYKLIGD